VKEGAGFLVKRALSLVETSAFRLPRTEKALVIGSEGFEDVSLFKMLALSHGNSGGDDGGLDAMNSSENMALSLGMGVDDMLVAGVDIEGNSAMVKMWSSLALIYRNVVGKNVHRVFIESHATWKRDLKFASASSRRKGFSVGRLHSCCRSSHVTASPLAYVPACR
jgi:hypothetical protein